MRYKMNMPFVGILLGTLLITTMSSVAEGNLSCALCANSTTETWNFCHLFPLTENCQNPTDVCYSWTKPDPDHVEGRRIAKGCMDRQECLHREMYNGPQCPQNEGYTPCTVCCDDSDMCNIGEPVFGVGNITVTTVLPTTTTELVTTTTIPTTTTMRILEAEEECTLTSSEECLEELNHVIDASVLDLHGEFGEFCREMSNAYRCILDFYDQCHNITEDQDYYVINVLFRAIDDMCPIRCDIEASSQCVADLYRGINLGAAAGYSCDQLQELFTEKETCIVESTKLCEPHETDPVRHHDLLEDMREILGNMCQTKAANSGGCLDEQIGNCVDDVIQNTLVEPLECVEQNYVDVQHTYCTSAYDTKCDEDVSTLLKKSQETLVTHYHNDCAPPCDIDAGRDCISSMRECDVFCKSLYNVTSCFEDNSAGCDENDTGFEDLYDMLDFFVEACKCESFKIYSDSKITVTEGQDMALIVFGLQKPPSVYCAYHSNCKVFVDADVFIADKPACLNEEVPYPQLTLTTGDHDIFDTRALIITEENWSQNVTLGVHGTLDMKIDGTQEVAVLLNLVVEQNGVVEEKHFITETHVTVHDKDSSSQCKSTGDPHITTFDDRYYNSYPEGYYTLYKHDKLPYEIEAVHQHRSISNTKAYNCGITIKAAGSLFTIDFCARTPSGSLCHSGTAGCEQNLRVKLRQPDPPTAGLNVYLSNDGKRYEAVLPHGTLVRVDIASSSINTYITPSAADVENTKGLCGYYNGDSADDLMMPDGSIYDGPGSEHGGEPLEFIDAWSYPIWESIMYECDEGPHNPTYSCDDNVCPPDVCTCLMESLVILCNYDAAGQDNVNNIAEKCNDDGTRQMRNQLQQDSTPVDLMIEPRHPSSSDYTDECQEYFEKSEVVQKCNKEVGTGLENEIQNCIIDMEAMDGDESFKLSALEAVKSACEIVLQNNPVIPESTRNGIKEIMCPNECSHNGVCMEGMCLCFEPYTGKDCSFNKYAIPSDLSLNDEGLCNMDSRDCHVLRIYGRNVVPGVECHVQEVNVDEDGVSDLPNATLVDVIDGDLLTFREVMCRVPLESSYYLQLKNPNSDLSEPMLYITYNSACHQCVNGEEPSCSRLNDNCVIDGQCYREQEEHPEDGCLICDSAQSSGDWTTRSSCEDSTGSTWVIVGTVLGSVAIVAAATVIGWLLYTRSKKRSKIGDSMSELM